jgi:hypothetical protein
MDQHLRLLARVVSGDREAVANRAAAGSFSPDRFLRFLWDHSLAGHVCDLLEAGELLDRFPDPFPRKIRRSRQDQEEDCRRIIERIGTLADAFEEADVDVVFLKGPTLATRFYGGPTARRTLDVDLWVGPDAIEAAGRVLEAVGHRRRSRLPGRSRAARHFAHNVEYDGPGDIAVDLHWAFAAHPTYRIDYPAIRGRTERVTLEGRRLRVLAPPDVLLLLVLGVFADLQRGRLRVRHLVDALRVAESIDAATDWDGWLRDRAADGTARIAEAVLALVLDALECRVRLPALSAALGRTERSRLPDRTGILRLLARSERGLRNKLWTFRLYRGGPAAAGAWWLASLPVKWAVYR